AFSRVARDVTSLHSLFAKTNYENDPPEYFLSGAAHERSGTSTNSTGNRGKIRLHQYRAQQRWQCVECFRRWSLLSFHCSHSSERDHPFLVSGTRSSNRGPGRPGMDG